MPLLPNTIHTVSEYCERDLGKYYQNYVDRFNFICDEGLRERLAQEFYIARYMAKFQEAMNFDEKSFQLLGHLKFQIVQYAGIYEAVISYLLTNDFQEDERVKALGKRVEYRKVDALTNATIISHNGEPVYVCRKSSNDVAWQYINFEEKLRVAKQIGFVSQKTSDVILETFKLRHSVHVEKAVKAEISFEIEQAKKAYETMYAFLSDIKTFLTK